MANLYVTDGGDLRVEDENGNDVGRYDESADGWVFNNVDADTSLKVPMYSDNTNAVQENESVWYNDGAGTDDSGYYAYDNGVIGPFGQGGVTVEDDGTQVVADATAINMNTNLTVTDDGDGTVSVDASGGGGTASTADAVVSVDGGTVTAEDDSGEIASGTDAGAVINSAITSIGTGKIYIQTGTYPIGTTISLPTNITLAGAGGTATTLSENGVSPLIQVENQSDHTELRNLNLDCANTAAKGVYVNGGGNGSGASNTFRFTAEKVRVYRPTSAGIHVEFCDRFELKSCEVEGVQADSPGSGNGILIENACINGLIENCRIAELRSFTGIAIIGPTTNVEGVRITDSILLFVTNGLILDNAAYAIEVIGNIIDQIGDNAVFVTDADNVGINGNYISANQATNTSVGKGVFIKDPSTQIRVINNEIALCYAEAVKTAATTATPPTDITIENNSCNNNLTSGSGNEIFNDGGERIRVSGNDLRTTAGASYGEAQVNNTPNYIIFSENIHAAGTSFISTNVNQTDNFNV